MYAANIRELMERVMASRNWKYFQGNIRIQNWNSELRYMSGGPPIIGPIVNVNCAEVAAKFLYHYANRSVMQQVELALPPVFPWQHYNETHTVIYWLGEFGLYGLRADRPGIPLTFREYSWQKNLSVISLWEYLKEICKLGFHRVFAVAGGKRIHSFRDHVFNFIVCPQHIIMVDVRHGDVTDFYFAEQDIPDQEAYFIKYIEQKTWEIFELYEFCAQ